MIGKNNLVLITGGLCCLTLESDFISEQWESMESYWQGRKMSTAVQGLEGEGMIGDRLSLETVVMTQATDNESLNYLLRL
jgi:hypothetical protein